MTGPMEDEGSSRDRGGEGGSPPAQGDMFMQLLNMNEKIGKSNETRRVSVDNKLTHDHLQNAAVDGHYLQSLDPLMLLAAKGVSKEEVTKAALECLDRLHQLEAEEKLEASPTADNLSAQFWT